MTAPGKSRARAGGAERSQARLAAVQALYQMDLAQTDVNAVVAEFAGHRFAVEENAPAEEADVEEREAQAAVAAADRTFFAELVRGVVRRQREIDPELDGLLAVGWRLARIDSILRAILRAAAFELHERTDVPARVVITEYVEVAHAFFAGDEPKVVNGVLDKLARRLRAGEF